MTNEEILGLGVSVGMLTVIALVVIILSIIALWKVFQKAGKPGWHSIVPFLNVYDLYDICWKGLYGVLLLVLDFITGLGEGFTGYDAASGTFQNPNTLWLTVIVVATIAMVVIQIIGMHKLSKSFGHGVGFTLGLIFLTPIFMLILAFGSSNYIREAEPVNSNAD